MLFVTIVLVVLAVQIVWVLRPNARGWAAAHGYMQEKRAPLLVVAAILMVVMLAVLI